MDDQQVAAQLADAFGRAAKSVVRAFDERLGDHGVSTPRSKLLAEIERLQPVRSADAARAVGITQATASTLVDALVREGLVVRAPDENDRRAVRLTTTAEGREQARAWRELYTEAAHEMFAGFSDDEKKLLTELLNKLGDALA
ncbi:MarR family winged helix-turn-helix transcriptional regulator [Mycolicibacterium monacense]|uniref:MarR family transcriptional regulator n=4 Tax=Mycobacteriaceae TaxID=1762 RepID=A0AAD1J1G6_MYCMB|nr:MarR family transcriptional regulator [Mycolicibacterium monacense]MDA4103414.1 MarR family transcriptional regulator [Mycolicibacterium monacense DSM 44395]OBB58941.1 MarR family transcriptional regulator [Mycolicibacterium monacense]OBF56482.1 MarR family transcriptional regulator [Mycolicibacterium monacense]ORB21070.1 MarR family transcriptional regulator [Mycolicibacterium monacense DSM 44395]QHP89003.1 MarR family transcriptional regulator [Mycolicibacterium monacense DSM 44395]